MINAIRSNIVVGMQLLVRADRFSAFLLIGLANYAGGGYRHLGPLCLLSLFDAGSVLLPVLFFSCVSYTEATL